MQVSKGDATPPKTPSKAAPSPTYIAQLKKARGAKPLAVAAKGPREHNVQRRVTDADDEFSK